jgi:hypothetical protein
MVDNSACLVRLVVTRSRIENADWFFRKGNIRGGWNFAIDFIAVDILCGWEEWDKGVIAG